MLHLSIIVNVEAVIIVETFIYCKCEIVMDYRYTWFTYRVSQNKVPKAVIAMFHWCGFCWHPVVCVEVWLCLVEVIWQCKGNLIGASASSGLWGLAKKWSSPSSGFYQLFKISAGAQQLLENQAIWGFSIPGLEKAWNYLKMTKIKNVFVQYKIFWCKIFDWTLEPEKHADALCLTPNFWPRNWYFWTWKNSWTLSGSRSPVYVLVTKLKIRQKVMVAG